jgi:hypothetical protein
MANLQISKQAMLKRVARFKELVSSEYAFVDSKIPGHERLVYNVIGNGMTEDASLRPAIPDARDFNLTYVKAEPASAWAVSSGGWWPRAISSIIEGARKANRMIRLI